MVQNVDGIKYIKATVNWVPTTPTITMSATTTIPTAAFNGTYDGGWNDIPQPTPSTQYLDGIGGVPTYRAQYRRWTGYNSLVLNWGVLVTASPIKELLNGVELREKLQEHGHCTKKVFMHLIQRVVGLEVLLWMTMVVLHYVMQDLLQQLVIMQV
ncbi:MAG: hypothetical protein IPH89_09745 [Bacteroidetes bacterium]|nr:hypothetical protein [Bacteroidota bacterium]